mmetsp:Transcript_10433/g.27642  ORF Transcript_10433/g.27642 Transcript_10433/m.27642 type:complete len:180 (+) Transcript_10433:37-576(+)
MQLITRLSMVPAAAVLSLMAASARALVLHSAADDCGKGFDNLNDGSKKYFETAGALWSHPARKEQFRTFEQELKCWYTYMLTTKCGDLPSHASTRKQQLTSMCNDVAAGWMPIWNAFSQQEIDWFKRTFPNDKDDVYATAHYRESSNTLLELNKKEVLCMTLFVIDDNCVDSMYIRTAS